MKEEVIQLKNISRFFYVGAETVKALVDVTLNIYRNEFVALMGPSGSGKSTMMNLLGCLDTPTSGSYFLNGIDVSKMSDNELADIRNKEIGFIFQTFNLLQRSTAKLLWNLKMLISRVYIAASQLSPAKKVLLFRYVSEMKMEHLRMNRWTNLREGFLVN